MRQVDGKAVAVKNKRAAVFPVLLALALVGCQKPAPVVMEAPPVLPVGHVYPTLVAVPQAPRYVRIGPEDAEQLQQAFNVIGLKSALMVGALSCEQQDRYDAFMTAFQPHILAEQHVMDAYFKRIGGHYGQASEDNFVTLLANNQSVSGIAQGSIFCLNNSAEFAQVLALKSPDALDSFVTDQPPAGAPPIVTAAVVVKHATRRGVAHAHLADVSTQ